MWPYIVHVCMTHKIVLSIEFFLRIDFNLEPLVETLLKWRIEALVENVMAILLLCTPLVQHWEK